MAGSSGAQGVPSPVPQNPLDTNARYQAAQQYAQQRHWRILPLHSYEGGLCTCGKLDCPSPGKHPRNEHGLTEATTDTAMIREWWGRWPNANVGIATGRDSRLFVVDADSEAEVAWLLGAVQGIVTPTVRTRKGVHVYFEYPPGETWANTQSTIPGLDTRGEGGYVVAPPSVRVDRDEYRWEVTPSAAWKKQGSPAEMPEDVRARLAPYCQTGAVVNGGAAALPAVVASERIPIQMVPVGRAALEFFAFGAPVGQQREKAVAAARNCHSAGWEANETAQRIFAALARSPQDTSRPWTLPQVSELVRSIWQAAPKEMKALTLEQTEGGIWITHRPEYSDPYTAEHLLSQTFPEPRWPVAKYLPEGLAILAGGPKTGKSWIAYALAIAVAGGSLALGELPVEQGEALYLALEDHPRRLQRRLRTLLGGEPSPKGLYLHTEWQSWAEGGLARLQAWIAAHPLCRLIVIDTMARVRPPRGKNDDLYASDYNSLVPVKRLADENRIAIVLIHHTRKMKDKVEVTDILQEVSGSTGLTGGVDNVLVLQRTRGAANGVLHVTGRDIEEDGRVGLMFDANAGGWRIVAEGEAADNSEQRLEILRVLRESPVPLSPAQIAHEIGSTPKSVSWQLRVMFNAGDVICPAYGRYMPVLFRP